MAVGWLTWILFIQITSIAKCALNQGLGPNINNVLTLDLPRDPGPAYDGAELHATMEAAALKALSIIEAAAKFTDEAEQEQSEKDGLPNIRFKRQGETNAQDPFPVDERVQGVEKSPEEEEFEVAAEAVIHQGLDVEPRLQNNLEELSNAVGLEPLVAEPVVFAQESTALADSSMASSTMSGTTLAGTGSTSGSSPKGVTKKSKSKRRIRPKKTTTKFPTKSPTGSTSSTKMQDPKDPPKAAAVMQDIGIPDSERVVEEDLEIVETNLNDEPLEKVSPDADAVRGILQVNEMERERFDFEPPGDKVSEDEQYAGQDYADSTSDSGSKDSGGDEIKKILTVEKVDSMIELMNVLNKDFGSILGKWDRSPNPKDGKGPKDGKDKDSKDSKDKDSKDSKDKDSKDSKDKDSKDSKDKDSKDGKGEKSDYDYDGGMQTESSSSTSVTTPTSSKSRPANPGKRRKFFSKMSSSMAPTS